MKTVSTYLFAVLLLGAVMFSACGDKHPVDKDVKEIASKNGNWLPITHDEVQETVSGIRVYSEKGDVTPEQMKQIEDGIDRAIAKGLAQYPEQVSPTWLNKKIYKIFVPTIPCRNVGGTQGFLVKAVNYDGTEFDLYNPEGVGVKDGTGVITAAERIWLFGHVDSTPREIQMMVCIGDKDLSNFTEYGTEHAIIINEDIVYGVATLTHGPPHPLLPKPAGSVGR